MKTTLYYFFLAFSLIAFTVACSKDDDSGSGNNGEEPDEYFISLAVTGDEHGEFYSDSHAQLSGSPNNGYEFIISRGPENPQDMSFTIFITSRYVDLPNTPLPTGSFSLIAHDDLEHGDGNYSAMFTNLETETLFGYEVEGTLNITESKPNYMKGNFSFNTTSYTNGDVAVTVEGSFVAPIQ